MRAGIFVKVPTQKAKTSETAAAVIDGPTSVIPPLILSPRVLPGEPFTAVLIMNILSTPIARIKNGMTSPEIIVMPILKNVTKPMEQTIEQRTIPIPARPIKNPECVLEGNEPIDNEIYTNMRE